jgi:hypothetical protein
MASRSSTSKSVNTGTAILGRLVEPAEATFSPEAARWILQLQFPQDDRDRVDGLSAKAREGTLSPAERTELEEYIRVADLLAMLKSKARLSLKNERPTSR